jgi:hypothetical protein
LTQLRAAAPAPAVAPTLPSALPLPPSPYPYATARVETSERYSNGKPKGKACCTEVLQHSGSRGF